MLRTLLTIISAVLILLFLIRDNKSDGIFTNDNSFQITKQRGGEKIIFIVSGVFVTTFIVLSFLLGVL